MKSPSFFAQEAAMLENLFSGFLIVCIWYLAQAVVYELAKRNLFWTIQEEGFAVPITRNGEFHKVILTYSGHRFTNERRDKKTNTVDDLNIYDIEKNPGSSENSTSWILDLIFPIRGIVWIGVPGVHEIYDPAIDLTDNRLRSRSLGPNRILVREYVYKLLMRDAEMEGRIPFEISVQITAQVTNPAKAAFRIAKYFNTSVEYIDSWARREFSQLSIDDFIASPPENRMSATDARTTNKLEAALGRVLEKTSEFARFGLTIHKIQVADITVASEQIRQILIQREAARQKASATVEEAIGEARAIEIVSEAAAKMDPKAIRLREIDALKNTRANITIIGGQQSPIPTIITVPSISQK